MLNTPTMIMRIPRMCFMAIQRQISNDRYRRYAEAKKKIPKDLTPAQYEAEIKRLAKKFKI